MQKDYLAFIGNSRHDNWVKIADRYYINRMQENTFKDLHRWETHPKEIELQHNLCVQVISEDPSVNELPVFVKESNEIIYLEIPLRFIPHLKIDSIPITVKTLLFTGDGRFEMPRNIQLPQVERLFVGYGELTFSQSNFPELRHLEFKLDRKQIMLHRLTTFKNLKVLGIHPCPNNVFSILEKLQLSYLRLNNSSLESLEGIERLKTLTDLWLQKWIKLTDMSPLAHLPLLEDVTLTYCKKIAVAEPLLDIPNLRRLFVWKCNNKALEQLVPALEKKNLEELLII